MRAVAMLAVVVVVASGACAPESVPVHAAEVVLFLDTDAPLPGARPGAPMALFDLVRIDLLPPGEVTPTCAGCTNEFDLTTDELTSLGASVGLAPAPGVPGYRARVRLFLKAFTSVSGEPDPDSTIDTTVGLPATLAETVTNITVTLPTDDVGAVLGTPDAPATPTPGAPSSTAVGTWPGAAVIACAGKGRPGQVCIPGGAFWLGTTVAELPHTATAVALRPRLARLSPFWLDDREVTVGVYRSFSTTRPDPWSGSTTGTSWDDWCTFTPSPGAHEDYPVNCIRGGDARAYCRALGADLPTEAQLEYASGGLRDQRFVWGEEDPACGDAIYGGGGGAGYFSFYQALCAPPAAPTQAPLPLAARVRVRDELSMPDGSVIHDLAGNLAEWARDAWNAPDEPCWAKPGVYADPWCETVSPSFGTLQSVRGGGWLDSGDLLLATTRYGQGPLNSVQGHAVEPDLGFRCATAGAP